MLKIDIKHPMLTSHGRSMLEVNLEIPRGELICVSGASGIGKTTLLRIISGLLKPKEGSVQFDGRVWCDTNNRIFTSAAKRRTGLMFQDFALFPNMTVMEQITYAQPQKSEEQARELLECFGISALASRRPYHLSGGQKQRVALARAIASEPSMLLLDEPFSALDWDLKESLRQSIKQAHEMLGSVTLLVCHDPADIAAMATSILHFEFSKHVVSAHIEEGKNRRSLFRKRENVCESTIECSLSANDMQLGFI